MAGAGAAATSALVGSSFGAAGTIAGAALGSVVITLTTAVYHRSLDRTRDTVKARVKLPGGRTVEVARQAQVPAPRAAPETTTGPAHVAMTPAEAPDPARPTRRIGVLLALTVLVFTLGMAVITGLELLKGETLTRGEGGTSIGRLITGGGAPRPNDEAPATGPATTVIPTAGPSAEPRRSGPAEPTSSAGAVSPGTNVTPSPITPTPTTGTSTAPTTPRASEPASPEPLEPRLPGAGPG